MSNSSEGAHTGAQRFGATAAVLATTAAALLTFDGTAAAAETTRQTINDAPERVLKGNRVYFTGTLYDSDGTPIADHKVRLERANGDGWKFYDSKWTNADGKVRMSALVYRTYRYRLVFRGSPAYAADGSPAQRVEAKVPVNERIVQVAAAQQGDPYRYGATGPDSFDCSGLTGYAHRKAGISIPRTSRDQYAHSRKISRDNKRKGDLIFMHNNGRVYHAAIYAGSGYMWTAPQSGERVKKAKIYSRSYYVGRAW